MAAPHSVAKRGKFRQPGLPAFSRAFTLVETVLALGLTTFVLTSLLGLLSCGLGTFRKAMDFTLQAQMAQHLVEKARHTPFDALTQLAAQPYYFDDTGRPVEAGDASGTFKAVMNVTGTTSLPADPGFANTGLAQVTITCSRKQAATSSMPTGTVVTYIAAMAGSSSQ